LVPAGVEPPSSCCPPGPYTSRAKPELCSSARREGRTRSRKVSRSHSAQLYCATLKGRRASAGMVSETPSSTIVLQLFSAAQSDSLPAIHSRLRIEFDSVRPRRVFQSIPRHKIPAPPLLPSHLARLQPSPSPCRFSHLAAVASQAPTIPPTSTAPRVRWLAPSSRPRPTGSASSRTR
jgi:hypothetical protein